MSFFEQEKPTDGECRGITGKIAINGIMTKRPKVLLSQKGFVLFVIAVERGGFLWLRTYRPFARFWVFR